MIQTFNYNHTIESRYSGATVYKHPGMYQLLDLIVKAVKYGILDLSWLKRAINEHEEKALKKSEEEFERQLIEAGESLYES